MRKVLNFVKGKKEDKKDQLNLNVSPIAVEITDPAGVTTPSDDYDFAETPQKSSDYEVDLSGKDKSITKLHKVAWVGSLEKVKTQLKKIDVNSVDRMNRTPLHLAVAQGHINVIWFLLNNKARMDIYDTGGKTPFLKAVECGFKDIVQQMLEKNAEIESVDTDGNSALHIATRLGFYDVATLLLKKGADFEKANKRGEYPLHIATTAEHIDLVELLLRYGANVNVGDSGIRTPLMLAAKFGNQQLIDLFLEFGAKKTFEDSNNLTAADYARHGGYEDIAAKLQVPKKVPSEELPTLPEEPFQPEQTLDDAKEIHESVGKETVDGNETDTWNDSGNSERAINKILTPGLKSKDDEVSGGENAQSPAKDEQIIHDSPHSCIIPPPLKPPRSWDLIQAGMIDDNQGVEVKRRSLTTLGTLRTRRESFTESKSEAELSLNEKKLSPHDKPKTIADIPAAKIEKNKSDLSLPDSDWGSDDSLPLDKSTGGAPAAQNGQVAVGVHQVDHDLPQPPSPTQLLQVEEQSASAAVSPEPLSERRARMMLLRCEPSVDLTLTEDKTDDKSDHSGGSLPPEGETEQAAPSEEGTLGRDGTMLGYDELWTGNSKLLPSIDNQPKEITDPNPDPESQIVINLDSGSVVQVPQGTVESLTKQLEEAAEKKKAPPVRRHSRQKSIFVLPPTNATSETERKTHIDKEMECYDEAIRELSNKDEASREVSKEDEAIGGVSKEDDASQVVSKQDEASRAVSKEDEAIRQLSKRDEPKVVKVFEKVVAGPSTKPGERPIRRKRKLLLAMRGPSPNQNEKLDLTDSSSDQDDDEADYWGAKVPRQPTVIRQGGGGDDDSEDADQAPSLLSAGSISLSDVANIKQLSSGTSNEDVTVPMEDTGATGDGSDDLQPGRSIQSEGKQFETIECADTPSDGSQEPPSSRVYSVSHDSLLKHHLQVVTEERSRLAETTVELGERTERLLYELADAREAARASNEVISILQQQLGKLEESHRRGLEDAQTQQFHLDSRDQELRHLSELCRKLEDEKHLLKDIISLKDKELSSLRKAENLSPSSEKDAGVAELRIHLKYVEQERDKLTSKVSALEESLNMAQNRYQTLLEEKARLSEQSAQELFLVKNDCSKWKNLYESSLIKIEAIDTTQMKMLMEGKVLESEAVLSYRDEIRAAVERIEKDKEQDREMWHSRIKEEVSEAVTVLKAEYEDVVASLKKQNQLFDVMVHKLENDLDLSQKRCQDLESQLKASLKDTEVMNQLRQTISDMKSEAVASTHRLELMAAELEANKSALAKANEVLEALQLKNDDLTAALTKQSPSGGDGDGLKTMVEELKLDLQQARMWASESSNKVQQCNQWAGELQRQLNMERERVLFGDEKSDLQKLSPLSPASEVRLSDALTMTDQVRWNSSGLMGVVQKQKEEIESLKAECQRLRKLEAQESKMSRDTVNLLQASKEILTEKSRQPPVVSPRKVIDASKGKNNKRVVASPKRTAKISELRYQLKEEYDKRLSAEKQMNILKSGFKENVVLEAEIERLRKDLATLESSWKSSELCRTRIGAENWLQSELTAKLNHVNKLIAQQAAEREKKATIAAQNHREQEDVRHYLVTELAKVQASLDAKGVEERELKFKCDQLSQESARRSEAERKKLIQKSLSLKLGVSRRVDCVEAAIRPVPRAVSVACPSEQVPVRLSPNPFSDLLRKQVQTCVEKYKSTECIADFVSACNPEEKLMNLRQKYLL